MWFVFILLALTIALLLWDRFPMEVPALGSVIVLVLSDVITVSEALGGFANPTVVSITGLFVVGASLFHTGVADWAARRMIALGGDSETRFIVVLSVFTAVLSAFLSNTGTIAVLLPAVVSAAKRLNSSPARFLMPLAFAAQIGGLLTLVGTPPNIVLADSLSEAGLRPFSFFEFSLLGVPMLLCYAGYVAVTARRNKPTHKAARETLDVGPSYVELTDSYKIQGKFYHLRVRRDSPLIGRTRSESHLTGNHQVHLLRIVHPEQQPVTVEDVEISAVDPNDRFRLNDILIVEAEEEAVRRLTLECNLAIQPIEQLQGDNLLGQEIGLAEVLITQRSNLVGTSIKDARFADKYAVHVLGVMRNGKALPLPFIHKPLQFGDSLLVFGKWRSIESMRRETRNFIVVGRPEATQHEPKLDHRSFAAVAALAVMVLLLLTKLVPTVIAILIAALAMIVCGCLKSEDAYRAVSWQSVILIAAMMPMSVALEKTRGAQFVADSLVSLVGNGQPLIFLAAIFLLTTGFSQFISNTATTVLVAPIALGAANALGISPYPVFMTVAAAASSAFLTPIASPVNTMVLGPGGYTFGDFAKRGFPLMLMVMVVTLILVPLIWPLT